MEDQVVEEQLKEIEYIASDELNVGLIERYLQELPEKILRLGVRVLLALSLIHI